MLIIRRKADYGDTTEDLTRFRKLLWKFRKDLSRRTYTVQFEHVSTQNPFTSEYHRIDNVALARYQ
jgi:hypothetical protein